MNILDNIATVGFILCREGKLCVTSNGKELELTEGMLCVYSPIINVSIREQSADCVVAQIDLPLNHVYPQLTNVMNVVARLRIDTSPYLALPPEKQLFFLERKADLEERRRVAAETDDEACKMLMLQSIKLLEQQLLVEMLTCFYRSRAGMMTAEASVQETVVFSFIFSLATNFRQQRSVEFYAEQASMTPAYFTRIVKGVTGRTPMEIIHTITCSAARNMLRQTSLSIKEIAREMGFPEQFTFRKYFKKHVGVSPTEYREGGRSDSADPRALYSESGGSPE